MQSSGVRCMNYMYFLQLVAINAINVPQLPLVLLVMNAMMITAQPMTKRSAKVSNIDQPVLP